jgi:hypothetical protein
MPNSDEIHLFTDYGNIEKDMCPKLLKKKPEERSKILTDLEICTICLKSIKYSPECPLKCPSRAKAYIIPLMCPIDGCNNRKIHCPNQKQHLKTEPGNADPRLKKAIGLGMSIAFVNLSCSIQTRVIEIK